MSFAWPTGMRCAAVLSFDVNGEAGILQGAPQSAKSLSALSWARYEPKVGVPRILDTLKAKEVRASFFVPGYTAELYPELIKRSSDEGHEIGIHGYLHEPVTQLDPVQEEAALVRTYEILEDITGHKPIGYRAPWWEMNEDSPTLLARHGILYDSSLMDDDRPYILNTGAGDLIEIPVHWTNDDWEQFAFTISPPTGSGVIETCQKAFQLWKEEFDGMYCYRGAFILTMHPEVIGRPARIMMLERLIDYMRSYEGVWLTTCEEVARHALAQKERLTEVEVGV